MNIKTICNKMSIPFFMVLILLIIFVSDSHAEVLSEGTVVSQIVNKFYEQLATYEQVMLKYARQIFYWCAILEIAYLGWKAALGATDIGTLFKNFCLSLVTAGFFLAVIHNYHEWAWNVINGLKAIAGEATPLFSASDQPFTVGLELAKSIFDKSGWNPANLLVYALAGTSIVICFALISLQIIFIKCECIVAMCASSILLGLGATSFFRDYAINAMRYIFAVAFKLMTMQLVIGVGMNFILELKIAEEINWGQIAVTISFCIIFYALVKTLPDIVAGIIQGAHVGSGSAISSTVAAAGGAAVGAAVGTVAGANTARLASQAASMQGKTGMGMVAGTAGNLINAGLNAMHKRSARAGTTSSVLREQIDQQRSEAEAAVEAERMRQQVKSGEF